ncbi:hypothetical protein GCM10017608_34430 [Agromyces luteolus]|uniref:DUF3099 domain-containing protein n=1 Tax=Agromyces luteolus TaxID=88373 RepID=A0A7C9LIX7_9MICO|nr:DUF3099 domain-containing protein [Agromyces luteolus]MUN08214.1 DUF3099 domain-containing protein [Agromyces luteolus]GLK29505.1 hypothetical protein GCM10017608_34430 [Agromyces luteolus]
MKHQPLQSITSLPPSPEAERRARMIKYTVMMSIRVACIVALLFVQGWWLLVFALGAVFLPYFAVVVANVATTRRSEVESPGGIVPLRRADGGTDWTTADAAGGTEPSTSADAGSTEGPGAAREPDAPADDRTTDDREDDR